MNEYVGESPIPVASVHRDAGAQLIKLAQSNWFRLTAKQTPYANYIYDLTNNYAGQVPDQALTYKPSQRDLARIDARYHAVADGEGAGFRYDMTFTPSLGFFEREWHPATRTEWVTPDQVWHESHVQRDWEDRAVSPTPTPRAARRSSTGSSRPSTRRSVRPSPSGMRAGRTT